MFEYTVCTESRENREEGRNAAEKLLVPFTLDCLVSLTFKIFTNPRRIYAE